MSDVATLDAQADAPTTPMKSFVKCNGVRFPKDPAIIKGRVRDALRTGEYESQQARLAKRLLSEGDVVMELGGGLGFLSTLMAKSTALKHVHVYEPHETLAPYIAEVHSANGIENVTLHQAALGPRKSTAKLHLRTHPLASSMSLRADEAASGAQDIEVRNAKTEMKAVAPTVLICDIQGDEAELIPAMDLSGLNAAMIALHPQWTGADGVTAIFRAMMDAGLSYYARGSSGRTVSFRKQA